MRIAICLSGQPRTWKKCFPRWMELFGHQGEIDFFFHLWDYNSLPRLLSSKTQILDEPISEEEKNDVISTLNPKKYVFDSKKPISYWNCNLPTSEQFGPWCIDQYYSRYYVSLLKQEYELENNFKYDIVIWQRADLYAMPETNVMLDIPNSNTVYTTHNMTDKNLSVYRIGDIFYYSDSITSDHLALFYKFLSFVPTSWVTTGNCPPPEVAFYFYMASIGILNNSIHGNFKVMRDERVLEIKGKLDGYETI
jgi:hypothetical protein